MSEFANVNLEESAEVVGDALVKPEPVQEAAPQADTPPPAQAPAEDADPEGTIEASGGVKFVPLNAVQAERGRRKEAEGKLKEKDALIEQLKPKAELYEQNVQYLDQAKPIIETIRANPDLVRLAKNPPQKQEPAGPLTQDQAVAYARKFDLFKTDGSPDVDRAQDIAKDHQEQMRAIAQQAVAPFHQQNAQQASEFNRRAILNLKDGAGNAVIDPEALNSVWRVVDPAESAKPEVATTLYRLALGLMAEKGMTNGTTRRTATEPVVPTESIGGGRPGPETLNHTGEAFFRASGQSRKDYMALRASVKLNEPNVLE